MEGFWNTFDRLQVPLVVLLVVVACALGAAGLGWPAFALVAAGVGISTL